MRSFKDNIKAVLSLSIVITIGLAFAGLTVVAYIIWTINDELLATQTYINANNATNANMNNSLANVTGGFDSGVNLLLVAITIFILALAISALLMLRQR